MQTTTSRHSLWLEAMPTAGYPAVVGDATFDIAVVGGGLAGLTTALMLTRTGARVAVIEADRVGAGVSGNNTAKVSALQATASPPGCAAAHHRAGWPSAQGDRHGRSASAGELLVLAGQSHSTGQHISDGSPYEQLATFAREHWDVAEVTHRWSAQDPTAYDQLPMIGTYRRVPAGST